MAIQELQAYLPYLSLGSLALMLLLAIDRHVSRSRGTSIPRVDALRAELKNALIALSPQSRPTGAGHVVKMISQSMGAALGFLGTLWRSLVSFIAPEGSDQGGRVFAVILKGLILLVLGLADANLIANTLLYLGLLDGEIPGLLSNLGWGYLGALLANAAALATLADELYRREPDIHDRTLRARRWRVIARSLVVFNFFILVLSVTAVALGRFALLRMDPADPNGALLSSLSDVGLVIIALPTFIATLLLMDGIRILVLAPLIILSVVDLLFATGAVLVALAATLMMVMVLSVTWLVAGVVGLVDDLIVSPVGRVFEAIQDLVKEPQDAGP